MSSYRRGYYLPLWLIVGSLIVRLCVTAVLVEDIERITMTVELTQEVWIVLIAGAILASLAYNIFNLTANYHEGKTKSSEMTLEALEDGRELTDLEKQKIKNWNHFDVIFVVEGLINVVISSALTIVLVAYIGADRLGIADEPVAVFGVAFIIAIIASWLIDMGITSSPATAEWEKKKRTAYDVFLSHSQDYLSKLADEAGVTVYQRLVDKYKSAGIDEAEAMSMAKKALINDPTLADGKKAE